MVAKKKGEKPLLRFLMSALWLIWLNGPHTLILILRARSSAPRVAASLLTVWLLVNWTRRHGAASGKNTRSLSSHQELKIHLSSWRNTHGTKRWSSTTAHHHFHFVVAWRTTWARRCHTGIHYSMERLRYLGVSFEISGGRRRGFSRMRRKLIQSLLLLGWFGLQVYQLWLWRRGPQGDIRT